MLIIQISDSRYAMIHKGVRYTVQGFITSLHRKSRKKFTSAIKIWFGLLKISSFNDQSIWNSWLFIYPLSSYHQLFLLPRSFPPGCKWLPYWFHSFDFTHGSGHSCNALQRTSIFFLHFISILISFLCFNLIFSSFLILTPTSNMS